MAQAKKTPTVGVKKEQIKPEKPTETVSYDFTEPKVSEVYPEKVTEAIPDEKVPVTRAVAFFNRSDVVISESNREKHLVKYLGTDRYWSTQQIEICLRDSQVTLVLDGSQTDRQMGKFLEFPRKTQVNLTSRERRPCIGCGK